MKKTRSTCYIWRLHVHIHINVQLYNIYNIYILRTCSCPVSAVAKILLMRYMYWSRRTVALTQWKRSESWRLVCCEESIEIDILTLEHCKMLLWLFHICLVFSLKQRLWLEFFSDTFYCLQIEFHETNLHLSPLITGLLSFVIGFEYVRESRIRKHCNSAESISTSLQADL